MTIRSAIVYSLVLCSRLCLTQLLAHGHSIVPGETSCSDEQAASQETYFRDHPQDTARAACLLDYYAQRLGWLALQAPRMWLIRWVITNHPGIRLDGHLDNDLRVGTREKADYSNIRGLWLEQGSRIPNDPVVLSNAANAIALTDRETAMNWLKHARELDPLDWHIPRYLGELCAAAIIGISETGADLLPTSIDPEEAQSPFARLAHKEAIRDAAVATATAQRLHVWTNYPRYLKYESLTRRDYDPLAEALLLRAADLDYPNPTEIAALGDFYCDQRFKPSGRIEPKMAVVEKAYEEIAQRFTASAFLRPPASPSALLVRVKILIGPDGHVWSARAENPLFGQIALMAQAKAESLTFRPLREAGRLLQVSTIVSVTLDEQDLEAIQKASKSH
jgi:hypothetical protein